MIFCITPDPPIVGTDRRETSAFLPMIARRMVGLMPKLANLKVRRTWRGLYPMTPDGKAPRSSIPAGALGFHDVETLETECLILGGGPAGLSAAIELGKAGVNVVLVDDKDALGGKLVLQTHKFFGSIEACHAGTRGIDIGKKLEAEVRALRERAGSGPRPPPSPSSPTARWASCARGHYVLVRPQVLLVATGAREKSLVFQGNTLPGVYGAGAFQTLVNRDLVRPTERLFVVGGGNVGLIAAYHALQAGIQVVGLCEALAECGGYKVHKDKLVRMGVPIYTRHTIVAANGKEEVESVTIAKLDAVWKVVPGTEQTFTATRCWSRWASTRSTSSSRRPRSSACRSSPPATPRRSPRPRPPCSPAASAA